MSYFGGGYPGERKGGGNGVKLSFLPVGGFVLERRVRGSTEL